MTQDLRSITPTSELALIVRDEAGTLDLEIAADPAGPVADLCALTVREGGLATQDGAGHPLRYVLALKREARFLDPGRSLAEEGVRDGDTLEIVTKMVGGRLDDEVLLERVAARIRRREAKRDRRADLHPIHGQALRGSGAPMLRMSRDLRRRLAAGRRPRVAR